MTVHASNCTDVESVSWHAEIISFPLGCEHFPFRHRIDRSIASKSRTTSKRKHTGCLLSHRRAKRRGNFLRALSTGHRLRPNSRLHPNASVAVLTASSIKLRTLTALSYFIVAALKRVVANMMTSTIVLVSVSATTDEA